MGCADIRGFWLSPAGEGAADSIRGAEGLQPGHGQEHWQQQGMRMPMVVVPVGHIKLISGPFVTLCWSQLFHTVPTQLFALCCNIHTYAKD